MTRKPMQDPTLTVVFLHFTSFLQGEGGGASAAPGGLGAPSVQEGTPQQEPERPGGSARGGLLQPPGLQP